MTLCAAICDDSPADRLAVQTMLSAWAQARQVDLQTDCFPSAEQFLFHYADFPQYDLLLLDVEMSAMDGVTMAKEVRKTNETVEIVFITGYTDYIAEGYDVGALHYLVKPLHREKFFAVLDKALSRRAKNARCLTLDCGGTLVRVSLPEIRYLESRDHGVVVCLGYNALFFEVTLPNHTVGQVLDVLDYISNYFLMPIVAIATCILIGWVVKPQTVIAEVTEGGCAFGRRRLYVVMVKVVTPILLFFLFLQSIGVLQMLGLS